MGADSKNWQRSFSISRDHTARFVLGPLHLWARRGERDWTLSWHRRGDPLIETVELDTQADSSEPPEADDLEVARFVCAKTADALRFSPRLADRVVVSRPEDKLTVLPGNRVSLWISTPLWVGIAEDPGEDELAELPTVRMSDSWTGENTRSGTICYATRTRARATDDVDPHPVRAVTRVEVLNRDATPLVVERINLPVPRLALFGGPHGWFTSELRVVREAGAPELSVEIAERDPAGTERTAEPREKLGEGGLLRGIQAFLQ